MRDIRHTIKCYLMKNSLIKKIPIAILLGGMLLGCDIVNDDARPPELNVQTFTFAEKPAVVNLSAIAGGKNVDVTGVGTPAFGKFETLSDTEGNKFLVYYPNQTFVGQKEELGMNLVNRDNNQLFAQLKLGVESLENGRVATCNRASGIYDYAKISSDSTLVLDLLDNDIFCGVDYNGGIVNEHLIQNINTEDVLISLGPGRVVTLTYTPPAGFTGKVLYMYDLGINWKVNVEGVGSKQILSDPYKYLEAFTTAMVEIDVVQ